MVLEILKLILKKNIYQKRINLIYIFILEEGIKYEFNKIELLNNLLDITDNQKESY